MLKQKMYIFQSVPCWSDNIFKKFGHAACKDLH